MTVSEVGHNVRDGAPAALEGGEKAATISAAALLAYALARRGILVELTVRGLGTAGPGDFWEAGGKAAAAVYLREGVSLDALEEVLKDFLESDHAGSLIYAPASPGREYHERLHVDGEARVVRVERHFHRVGEAPVGQDRLVGSIVRIGEATRGTRDTSQRGQSVFGWLRRGLGTAGSIQVARMLTGAAANLEGEVLASWSAEERAELAQRVGFRQVGEDCYAAEETPIAEGAFLRGPLFIDAGVEIGATDIHVGPAWLRAGGPPVTVATGRGGERKEGAAGSRTATAVAPLPVAERRPEYFVGPTLRAKPVYDLCKRAFDFSFALFWMIVLFPILFTTAVLIKLYDWGPIFFVHEREGLHGKPFGCVKFRSMVRNAEAMKEALKAKNLVDGPQFKVAKDPRITPIGRFIRKTNIDELPQLWNVLLGQMSIVGPRPSPFKENQLCPPWREARLSVKPGITGLWQVSRSRERGAADFQEWIVYDTQYVEKRGFFLDMKLILLTVKEILGKGQ